MSRYTTRKGRKERAGPLVDRGTGVLTPTDGGYIVMPWRQNPAGGWLLIMPPLGEHYVGLCDDVCLIRIDSQLFRASENLLNVNKRPRLGNLHLDRLALVFSWYACVRCSHAWALLRRPIQLCSKSKGGIDNSRFPADSYLWGNDSIDTNIGRFRSMFPDLRCDAGWLILSLMSRGWRDGRQVFRHTHTEASVEHSSASRADKKLPTCKLRWALKASSRHK